MAWHRLLADVSVVAHLGYVLFVIVGLAVILVGAARGWGWIRNVWFRLVHFLAIGLVAAEAILGVPCPLTTLENSLREKAGETVYPGSFIGYWAHELLFYDLPNWVFTVVYCLFALVVLLTLVLVPPRRSCRRK